MKVGDLVKTKTGLPTVGIVVDIIKEANRYGTIRVLWSDSLGKSLEYSKTLKLVQ